MYILGLTGPIASGKSTVAKFFKKENIPVINADTIVYDCYTKNTPVFSELITEYGTSLICKKTGNIDRQKLAQIIQKDPSQLKKIEDIVHPQVRLVMKFQLAHAYSNSRNLIVLSVPLMFKNNFNTLCDSIACCSCSDDNRHRRFMEREESSEEKWQFITSKQLKNSDYLERCHFIINTDSSLLESEHSVLDIIGKLSGEEGKKWHNEWRQI